MILGQIDKGLIWNFIGILKKENITGWKNSAEKSPEARKLGMPNEQWEIEGLEQTEFVSKVKGRECGKGKSKPHCWRPWMPGLEV